MPRVGYVKCRMCQGLAVPRVGFARVEYAKGMMCQMLAVPRVGYVNGKMCQGCKMFQSSNVPRKRCDRGRRSNVRQVEVEIDRSGLRQQDPDELMCD